MSDSKDGFKIYVNLLISIAVVVVDGEIRELLLEVEEVGRDESSRDVGQGREDFDSASQKTRMHSF